MSVGPPIGAGIADWMRLAVFLGFVGLGLAVARAGGRAGQGRRPVAAFVLYVLVVSTTVGLVQRESWPFTNWALFHHLSPARLPGLLQLELLDAAGQPYPVDGRVWEPLAPEELDSWMNRYFRRLDAGQRTRLAAFLLARAEAARLRLRDGGAVGVNGWLLGPVAAPYHFRRPAVWRSAASVPVTAFTGLRVWEVDWHTEAGRAEARRLLFEFHDTRAG